MSTYRSIAYFISVVWLAGSANAADTAQLETYVKPSGESYFSLSLADDAAKDDRPRDVVVLFDSSASQAGKYRASALDALNSLLGQLQPTDKVQLMSVDLGAIEMNKSFAAPNSADVAAGVAKIRKRVPLGTTDMDGALKSAIKALAARTGSAKTVVYIGDGNSAANLIDSSQFGDLARALAEAKVSVSSYAVGPQVNTQMLAALANHTGGVMAVENGGRTSSEFANQAGKFLADSVRAAVV
ncbi:MAG: VWA domain-containing protein, partial [Pirellulales bacterium]|nr:VWA domain-containing protein [Pirellulales bacterium]